MRFVNNSHGAAAVETGEGNVMRRGIGAVVGYAGETPVEADWRVVKIGDGKFTGTGPFYGGAKFQIGEGHAAQGNGQVDITALKLRSSTRFSSS